MDINKNLNLLYTLNAPAKFLYSLRLQVSIAVPLFELTHEYSICVISSVTIAQRR